jgi:hypothetical protein
MPDFTGEASRPEIDLSSIPITDDSIRAEANGTLMELLNAYERTMNTIDNMGSFVMVTSRSFLRIPRPTWFLRTFVVHHIDRALDDVCRRYVARAALQLGASEEDEHRAARYYRESLPPVRRNTYAVLLITLAIVVASMTLPSTVAFFGLRGTPDRYREFITALESQATNPFAITGLLDQLGHANYDVLTHVIGGILLIMYIILRPISAVFRVKRMIFNLYPNIERLSSVPISLSVRKTTGLYALEESVRRHIGARQQPDFPFDLLVSTLPILFFATGFAKDFNSPDPSVAVIAVVAEVLIVMRLTWLFQTWRRRGSSQPGSLSEVIVTTTSRRVTPLIALALSIISVLLSLAFVIVGTAILGLLPGVAALLLAGWSDAASTYSAGRYSRRRIALAAKILACVGIFTGVMLDILLGNIQFGPTP